MEFYRLRGIASSLLVPLCAIRQIGSSTPQTTSLAIARSMNQRLRNEMIRLDPRAVGQIGSDEWLGSPLHR